MINLKYLKPLTRHKQFCHEASVSQKFIKLIVYNYYHQIIINSIEDTIINGTLLILIFIVLIVIVIINRINGNIICFYLSLMLFIIMVLQILKFIKSTAKYKIKFIEKEFKRDNYNNLKCYVLKISKRYKDDKGRYIIIINDNPCIKLNVEKEFYNSVRVRSNMLLFALGNKSLFYCSIKQLNNSVFYSIIEIPDVTVKDVITFYDIKISCYITTLKQIFNTELNHYRMMLNDLKKKDD